MSESQTRTGLDPTELAERARGLRERFDELRGRL
jgi:hypothetical protein